MAAHHTATFAEHIHELRTRLMWSLLFVAIGAGLGYALHGTILEVLQQPLNEKLYYTAPTGAFSFIIKLCVVFGFVVALPMVVYQAFAFFGPLLPKKTKRSIVSYALLSVLLAAAGIAFAYFVSLPAALHFLVNFGSGAGDIQAIITADEYFNFVLAYIAGFAALFQLPLVVLFINRVKPLKPSQFLGGTRYVVLGSFIVSAIITPTPDPLNQTLMAGPIILLYFLSVLAVAVANRIKQHRNKKSAVPESILSGIDELVTKSTASQKALRHPTPVRAPAPLTSQPTVQQSAAMPRGRLTTDMVTSRHVAPTPSRPLQRAPARPPIHAQPRVRMALISDFVPTSK